MKDKNGKELFLGDWVLFDSIFENDPCISTISKILPPNSSEFPTIGEPIAYLYIRNDPTPWRRQFSELKKLSEDEAMIWILENR